MTTKEGVTALLPLITPYMMPEDTTASTTLYTLASGRVAQDAPGITDDRATEAICWYIAHLLNSKEGSLGVTSEHIGQWSATYAAANTSNYLTEYERVISDASIANTIKDAAIVEHQDAYASDFYGLDDFEGGDPWTT